MTVREAISAFDDDEYDDFFSGPPEYKTNLLRYYGVSEEDIAAYLSLGYNGENTGEEYSGDSKEDAQQESLKWSKRQTWLNAAAVFLAAVGLAVAIVSCQRG